MGIFGKATPPGAIGIGQALPQVPANIVTVPFTNVSAAGGSFQLADASSGVAPLLQMPNDGNLNSLYRVEFVAPAWKCSVADIAAIGFGTAVGTVTTATNSASLPTTNQFVPGLVGLVPGDGRLLRLFTECAVTGHTITVQAGPGQFLSPAFFLATRVK